MARKAAALSQPIAARQSERLALDGVDVVAAKDDDLLTTKIDLSAAELAVDYMVAFLHRHGNDRTLVGNAAFAYCQHNAGGGLLLGFACQEQARSSGLFGFVLLDDNAIAQWFQVHTMPSFPNLAAHTRAVITR